MVGIGLASMLMVNTINVTIQNSVPDALRGRVMSLYVTVFAGTAPIGGLFAGAMAQAFGAAVRLQPRRRARQRRARPRRLALRSVRMPRLEASLSQPTLRRSGREDGPTGGMTRAPRVVSMGNFPREPEHRWPSTFPAPRTDQPRALPLRAALGGLKRGFEALGVRNYRLYWSGQVVSLVGTWMQQVSLPWLVLSLGGSPLQLGFVAVLQFGPSMILAPFGGVFADRIDKRHALIATPDRRGGAGVHPVPARPPPASVEIWMVMVMALCSAW